MKLSICTPSIPSRLAQHLLPLIHKIDRQIGNLPVEHLVLFDNKRRTIGGKRQALLDIARGEYIAFVDDDDDVADDYVKRLLDGIEDSVKLSVDGMPADVITFKQYVFINKVGPFPLTFKRGHKHNEEPNLNGFTRPPWHPCAWRSEIAKACRYSDKMYGEDWDWAEQANRLATTSHHIERFLCTYQFNETVTEAK